MAAAWKLYFVFFVVLSVLGWTGTILAPSTVLLTDLLIIPIGLVGLVGLFGFCFHIDLGWPYVWGSVLLLEVVHLVHGSIFGVDRAAVSPAVTLADFVILAVVHGPYWYALYRLASGGGRASERTDHSAGPSDSGQ